MSFLSNRNIISKNATSMFDIPSGFPQTIAMDETHRNILQRNQELLVRDLIFDEKLFEKLSDVFATSMVLKIQVC